MSKLQARMAKMKKNIGLSLGSSQKELIMERANVLNNNFEESQKASFHNKYVLCEDKKLGEG